jgi:hypothetical protein
MTLLCTDVLRSQTHLLHHNFGSGSLSACCNFENGVVTRFLSIRAELKIGSACA